MKNYLKSYIGTKDFYKRMLTILVPIIIQNAITNFVDMLDNIMVGRIGTEQMSGVAISNQLIFVYNLCIFGAVSGAGIFTAQFYGSGDEKGIRDTMRFKLLITLFLGALFTAAFGIFGEPLVGIYLKGEGTKEALAATSMYALKYMDVMLLGLIPFALVQVYAGTLRECGETLIPMHAGLIAVGTNLVLNYVLIYGKFGAPVLGVIGAALATVISRYVELLIVVIYAHLHTKRFSFIKGLYRRLFIPWNLAWNITKTGFPLLINETMWAAGISLMVQSFSLRGLDVVGGMNIANTVGNVFNAVYISMGSATAIIVGQELGAGKLDTVRGTVKQIMAFGVLGSAIMGGLLAMTSPYFPLIYNTTDSVRHLATGFICCSAICAPLNSITNMSYFTIRSGGKTFITFLFDSVFVWCVNVPVAYLLSVYSPVAIIPLVLIVYSLEAIKGVIGIALIKKGVWINNIVSQY